MDYSALGEMHMVTYPEVEKYDVCHYTHRNLGWGSVQTAAIKSDLEKRTFKVVKSFDNIAEAREFIVNTTYVIQYVFKEA